MADPLPLPMVILVALGAALGGADALCVVLQLAGRSPFLDIAICLLVLCVLTAYLLGVVLVMRFVREGEARPAAVGQGGAAPRSAATDRFAQVTLMVSVGVAFLATACLLVVPLVASGSGSDDVRSRFPGFPWRSPTPVGVAFVVAVAVVPLFTCGGDAASRRATATDARRWGKLTSLAVIVSTAACILGIPVCVRHTRGDDVCSA